MTAEFPGLLRGLYRVHAGRTLTQGEAAGAAQPIRGFGDGRSFNVDALGDVPLSLALAADEAGGIVISEIRSWGPPPQETNGSYGEARYLEVYNNSDATLFLDGLVFGLSMFANETMVSSCAMSQSAPNDPGGVYARQVSAFPGDGGDYPNLPGEAKLVAVSAIDHSPIHPDLYDLSGADFEFRGVVSAVQSRGAGHARRWTGAVHPLQRRDLDFAVRRRSRSVLYRRASRPAESSGAVPGLERSRLGADHARDAHRRGGADDHHPRCRSRLPPLHPHGSSRLRSV